MRLIVFFCLVFIILTGCGLFAEAPPVPTVTAVPLLPSLAAPNTRATPTPGHTQESTGQVTESNETVSPAASATASATAVGLADDCSGPPPGWTFTYIVQAGDTLGQMGVRFNVTVAEIIAANCLESDLIFIGQTLYLPQSVASQPSTNPGGSGPTPSSTVVTPITFLATSTSTPSATPTLVTPIASGPGDEDLTIVPALGLPGTSFNIQVVAFPPNDTVSIRITHGVATLIVDTTLTTDNMGNANYIYNSPTDAATGNYLVRASATDITLTGEFRIDPPPVTNTPTTTRIPPVTRTPTPTITPTPTLARTETPEPTSVP